MSPLSRHVLPWMMAALSLVVAAVGAEPTTGPATEQRFPPLVVPEGFQATLFACDPLVEYPSVIALGPRAGSLFVAHDYMTGLGTEIVRRDEIRLVADTDGDGYADCSTLYAGGFNSLQGLAYHGGTVFAMHAPLLTALRDTDGNGVADERHNLIDGLGLTPENNPTRLHCANGVAVGHDGWLYLAMGDNGTNVARPEGDRLILRGGGILRCRADGSDLHVFSTGLRNIYDVALDEDLNVFVRDNENDGGDYMLRVCHSFHNADHGYPYLYYERPDEALAPLADLGRGSSAGGACYLETAFPSEFRGNLFFCEWGRAIVRYGREPTGSSFAAMQELDLATGAANDTYGFKPTDLVVDRDGSLLISDWCDGQRPKRGRARIYRISYRPKEASTAESPVPLPGNNATQLISNLDSPSYHKRLESQLALEAMADGPEVVQQSLARKRLGVLARMHAVWILSHAARGANLRELFAIAEADEAPRVRTQAIRAIADLTDPVLLDHRLDAERGDPEVAARLAALATRAEPDVQLATVVALGRLHWPAAPTWLRDHLRDPDAALAHAAMQTLRRSDNWPGVLTLLDEPSTSTAHTIAQRAIAGQPHDAVVDGLISRCGFEETEADRRREYADALARVYRKPGPWVYWGYRPAPRPANSESWERTEVIAAALDGSLADADLDVRAATLRRMQREGVPVRWQTLGKWLREDRNTERVDLILASMAAQSAKETDALLDDFIRDSTYGSENRRHALQLLVKTLPEAEQEYLLHLSRAVDDGPVLVDLLIELAQRPGLASEEFVLGKLSSAVPEVRAAAITASAALGLPAAAQRVPSLLKDHEVGVRRAAAAAAGPLNSQAAVSSLLELSSDGDAATRSASLTSLRLLHDPTAVPSAVAGLDDPATQLAAIEYLGEFGGPEQLAAMKPVAISRSLDTLSSLVRAWDQWQTPLPSGSPQRIELDQAIAHVQGDSGLLLRWKVITAETQEGAEQLVGELAATERSVEGTETLFAAGTDSQIEYAARGEPADKALILAYADAQLEEPARLQFLGSSNRPWRILLNKQLVHQREQAGAFRADGERFEAELPAGSSRVMVEIPAAAEAARFHLHFRRVNSSAEHERLTRYVLQNTGNVERGREVFRNTDKSICNKCHRWDGQGGTVGPDLTGVSRRFSRIHLIESILEPSRTIAPSYETTTVALASGRVVTGVRVVETADTLTIGDDQGTTHEILKSEIDERMTQPRSTMPEGLEKRLSDREFLDLITFLLAQSTPP